MKIERHEAKASEIENTLNELMPDPAGKHVVAVVELTYGLLQHLIAAGCEKKFTRHKDSHVGLPAFLREQEEGGVAHLFEKVDQYRAGRWYGGKGNGRIVSECLNIIKEVKKWSKKSV